MNDLRVLAENFGVQLSDKQLDKFDTYYKFLCEYSSHTNIVASVDRDIVLRKHFLDSLAFLKLPFVFKDFSLLDVGSGGGFPVVPISITHIESSCLAIDSVGKKSKFLIELAEKLEINNRLRVLNTRVEDLGVEHKSKYDFSTARAVAPLNILLEYCLPYVKEEGFFIAYKAKTAKDEISQSKNALNILGGHIAEVLEYKINENETHNLIVVEKIKSTPAKYPRKLGKPKKMPL